MRKKIIFLFFILTIFPGLAYSVEVKETESFYLEQTQDVFIQEPVSFFVTDDKNIFLLDQKACNLKIFGNNGKIMNVMGRKGQGRYEFINPLASASYKDKVLIYDYKKKKLFFYKRDKNNNLFKYKKLTYRLIKLTHRFI